MTERSAILARLVELAASNAGRDNLALRLAHACQTILGIDGAAITVENSTVNRTTLCVTDAIMARLEDLQDVTGEGPCRDAFMLERPVKAHLGHDGLNRWPEFTRTALQAVGPVTMYSFPMRPTGETFGVISVHVRDGRSLPESDDIVQFLADSVGAALLREPPASDPGNDSIPWTSRAAIHQATGMVVVQLKMPPADAAAVLRAHAFATERSLVEVARLVLDRMLDFKRDSHDS